MQTELLALGNRVSALAAVSPPRHAEKIERFHQTTKSYLAKQPRARSIAELQAQVDRFVAYYNDVRPHRAKGRMTPRAAFEARQGQPVGTEDRGRRRRPGSPGSHRQDGVVTLRHGTRLHHIGVGRAHAGKEVILLIDGLDVKVLTKDGGDVAAP
jgi:hypothetical protein